MKAESEWLNVNNLTVGVLGVVAALLVYAVLSDRQVPLISGDRATFVALFVLGFAMCAMGSLSHIQPGEWTHPLNISASVLGILAVLIGAAVVAGITLPLLSSARHAFLTLAIIVGAKLVLATVHHALLDRVI